MNSPRSNPKRAGSVPRRRPRSEAGFIPIDLIAILALVALVGALLIAVGIPRMIADGALAAVDCAMDPDGCDPGSDKAAEAVGEEEEEGPAFAPCTLSSVERTRSVATDVLLSRTTSGSRYLVRERSDGAVEVLETTSSGKGNVVAGGAKVGSGRSKVGVSAGAATVAGEERGHVYVLETREEQERFARLRAQPAIDAYVNPMSQLHRDPDEVFAMEALKSTFRDGSYKRTSKGVTIDGTGGVRLLEGGLGIGGEAGVVVETDDRTGDQTITYDVKASGAGDLGTILLGGVSGGVDDQLSVSLTVGSDGEPKHMALTREVEAGVGADLSLDPTRVADLPSFVQAAAGMSASRRGGGVLRITAGMDLEDEESRRAALAFSQDPSVGTAHDLAVRLDDSGYAVAEALRSSTEEDGYSLGLSLIASLGREGKTSVRSLDVVDAWAWDPEKGLVRRTECIR